MFDLIVKNANLPDGRKGIDIAVAKGTIAAVEPGITAGARDDRRYRPPRLAPVLRPAFPYGRHPLARPAADEPLRHVA